jgi:very-short-patch-repair endonuclease
MTERRVADLLANQAGVVARRQLLDLGISDDDIERKLRRREWVRVHRGVYVDHGGRLTWIQKAWAVVLYYWPAALCHASSLRVQDIRTTGQRDDVIHIAVSHDRRVTRLDGVKIHRVTNLSPLVQPNRSPARIRLENALLAVASAAPRDSDAIAVLGDACQCRRTTPTRLVEALKEHPRLPRRRFLTKILDDAAQGAYSVLEHRYLTRVERPHGLPTAKRQRQVRPGRSLAYRDVDYLDLSTVVELDGRLGHEKALDRWDDMERDVDSVVDGLTTMRVGWQQVETGPCRTAHAVARVLKAHGWDGRPKPCAPTCPLNTKVGVVSAAGAGSSPITAADSQEGQSA